MSLHRRQIWHETSQIPYLETKWVTLTMLTNCVWCLFYSPRGTVFLQHLRHGDSSSPISHCKAFYEQHVNQTGQKSSGSQKCFTGSQLLLLKWLSLWCIWMMNPLVPLQERFPSTYLQSWSEDMWGRARWSDSAQYSLTRLRDLVMWWLTEDIKSSCVSELTSVV